MGQLVGPDGKAVNSKGETLHLPGLDMRDPVTSLDLLGAVGRGSYVTAAQYAAVAGPKGERHVKILARDIASLASQNATVAEFASNVMAELAFTLAEAEARVAVLKGLMPEDKLQEAEKADMDMATEWENRRNFFSNKVPLTLRKKNGSQQRIGVVLAETIAGPAPTKAEFDALVEEIKAAGLAKEEPAAADAPAEVAPLDEVPTTEGPATTPPEVAE